MPVQRAHTSKRLHDGTDTVIVAVADGVSASTMPHMASQFLAHAIGALEPAAGHPQMVAHHGSATDVVQRTSPHVAWQYVKESSAETSEEFDAP